MPALLKRLRPLLRELHDLLVSLKLTVVLLLLGMVLVFAGTLDQVNLGIWAAQEKYFRSFVVYGQIGGAAVPLFPGGYLIGGLLLLNLIVAHFFRFAFAWRKAGIIITHFGLILLLVGELLSGLWQEDNHLRLTEGETKNYIESSRENELAFIDVTNPAFDEVVAIPEERLARKQPLQHPKLPFRVVPQTFYPNASLRVRPDGAADHAGGAVAQATAGFGARILAAPEPVTYQPRETNLPAAFVELVGTEGSLGTYLVSPLIGRPQEFQHAGRTWRIVHRTARTYQPFSLTLLKFTHERYAGTEIPKNFSSRLKLKTETGRDDREVLIYMNNPLRYGGLTFYQAGFDDDDRTTILQVVRNPSWLLPYIACGLMTLGLTLQFLIHLGGFIAQRNSAAPRAASALPIPATHKPARRGPLPS